MLSILRALYRDFTVRVRTEASPGRLSDHIPLLRGLRQDRPAYSTLFNIYIYDIFLGATALGCEVPGLRNDLSQSHIEVPGLLFADDAVATTPSLDSLERMLDHLSEWSWAILWGLASLSVGPWP